MGKEIRRNILCDCGNNPSDGYLVFEEKYIDINGCCGGCVAATNVRFCFGCGKELKV